MGIVWELDEDYDDGSHCFTLGLTSHDYLEYGLHVNVYFLGKEDSEDEGDDKWHIEVQAVYPDGNTRDTVLDVSFDTEDEARAYAERWALAEYYQEFDANIETHLLDQLYAILHPNRNMLTGELARIYRCVDKTLHPYCSYEN